MARGTYIVGGSNVTITGAATVTLAFINPGTTCSLEFLRAWVSQRGTTTQAQIGVQISTQVTAFPTLTGATPQETSPLGGISQIVSGTAGAAGTSGINASAEGAGAKTVIHPDNFNNLIGWLWLPAAHETIVLSAGSSSGFGLVLVSQPATLSGWSFGVEFREW